MILRPRRQMLCALGVLSLVRSKAYADGDDGPAKAPFGLTWGMSADQVRGLGATLGASSAKSDYGKTFHTTTLPKALSDTEAIILSFGFRDQLIRVMAVGENIGPDPYGSQIEKRYSELADALANRYGKGKEIDQRDGEVWKKPSEYLMSLKQGRAKRFMDFSAAYTDVQLDIRAIDSATAHYIIFFESKPGMKLFEAEKKEHEKDSL